MLEVSGLTVAFGGLRALDGVSLTVAEPGICGVIGPNGAGKTTLFDVISGLRASTAGSVAFLGTDITRSSVVWRAVHGIRRTFQRTQLVGELTVAENVLVGLDSGGSRMGLVSEVLVPRRRRASERAKRLEVDAVLDRCRISGLADVQVALLPIGLMRIVELARALVADPRLLLLDEPTSGLNEAETAGFGEILDQVRSTSTLQILLIEHDVPFVMRLCRRVLVMDAGRIIADGDPAAVQADDAVRNAYLT
ncbi:MAG TPA: ABC transporter ATP-binding protein [Acidimicrobiales bacterium]|nr:ABC transporter ATP-binding protein [Acidimicrobiales bacterium]